MVPWAQCDLSMTHSVPGLRTVRETQSLRGNSGGHGAHLTPDGALPPCKRHVMSPSSPVGVKARAASGPCGLRDFDKGAIYGLRAAQGNPETSHSGRGQLPSLGLRREERGRKSPMWSRVSWEVGTDCPRALWSCGHSQGQSRGPTEKTRSGPPHRTDLCRRLPLADPASIQEGAREPPATATQASGPALWYPGQGEGRMPPTPEHTLTPGETHPCKPH